MVSWRRAVLPSRGSRGAIWRYEEEGERGQAAPFVGLTRRQGQPRRRAQSGARSVTGDGQWTMDHGPWGAEQPKAICSIAMG